MSIATNNPSGKDMMATTEAKMEQLDRNETTVSQAVDEGVMVDREEGDIVLTKKLQLVDKVCLT